MQLMKNILLPTDFSNNSWNAIQFALKMFENEETTFYLMHVYQNEVYDHIDFIVRDDYETILRETKATSEKNLAALLEKIKNKNNNDKHLYQAVSSFNTLVEESEAISHSKSIDLIVMGTKGKSNKRNIAFGSYTMQVLKYVQSPVLAIPPDCANVNIKRILFPSNLLIPYQKRELTLVNYIASKHKSAIDILFVSKSSKLSFRQEDNLQFIKECLFDNSIKFHPVKEKNVSFAIKEHLEKLDTDLLVMVNTQHSFMEDMLFPSTLDKVSLDLKIPLLALQNATRPNI